MFHNLKLYKKWFTVTRLEWSVELWRLNQTEAENVHWSHNHRDGSWFNRKVQSQLVAEASIRSES